MEWIVRLLALALSALASSLPGVPADPGSRGGGEPAPPEAARPAGRTLLGAREEHFVLELVDPAVGAAEALIAPPEEGREIGLAVLRKRREADRLLFEWELYFAEPDGPDTHVHHVEVVEQRSTRFVWREYRPGAGRTLFIEELAPGHLRSVEWGGPDGLREELALSPEARFPLLLLEELRAGRVHAGELPLLEPLTGAYVPVTIETRAGAAPRAAAFRPSSTVELPARTVRLVRPDGTLAGAYRFEGSELTAFQWQAGGARGRRVPPEAWRRRLQRLHQADDGSEEGGD